MYNWNYIVEATLSKLDIDIKQAIEQKLLDRFHIYANEAITQICSSVKPKATFAKFTVEDKLDVWKSLCITYNLYHTDKPIVKPDMLNDNEKLFWKDFESRHYVNELVDMPFDFVSFGDDICTVQETLDFCYGWVPQIHTRSVSDEDFTYVGYNQLKFFAKGIYEISYNARWITFTNNMNGIDVLKVPADILDCLPSYIASQCYKIDDETKSALYRNEYEMFLARIDNSDFKNTKTFKIKGGW